MGVESHSLGCFNIAIPNHLFSSSILLPSPRAINLQQILTPLFSLTRYVLSSHYQQINLQLTNSPVPAAVFVPWSISKYLLTSTPARTYVAGKHSMRGTLTLLYISIRDRRRAKRREASRCILYTSIRIP